MPLNKSTVCCDACAAAHSESDNFCHWCGNPLRPIVLADFFPVPVCNEWRAFCAAWHGGQTSAFYSVTSTRIICNADIFRRFVAELRDIVQRSDYDSVGANAVILEPQDAETLTNMYNWAERIENALSEE